uniref:Ig-like domain-containing protein n=1 Tax=Mola mola TaxID=94237 RepID=A0A3Q4BV58_MOLML
KVLLVTNKVITCLITLLQRCALKIVTQILYVAVGDSVTLSCHFSLAIGDVGVLDVEWSIKPADILKKRDPHHLVSKLTNYLPHCMINGILSGAEFRFLFPDLSSGSASISFTNVPTADTNTYQCKIRKGFGIIMVIIHLDVMDRPAKPKCYQEVGFKLVLRHRGTQSSSPIWYRWAMETGDKVLPPMMPLLILCKNCLLTLKSNSTVVSVTVLAAAVDTVLVVNNIITTIIVSCHRKRQHVEYFGNMITEDDLPQVAPSTRVPCTRQSFLQCPTDSGQAYSTLLNLHCVHTNFGASKFQILICYASKFSSMLPNSFLGKIGKNGNMLFPNVHL